jgi:GAF domain-containing protein
MRTLNLSTVVSNQLLLRNIILDLLEDKLDDAEMPEARRLVCSLVDRSVQEVSILMEEHAQMQSVLIKCLSCAPGDRSEVEQSFAKFCRNAMDYFDADFVAVFEVLEAEGELECMGCYAKGVAISRGSRMQLSSFPLAQEVIDNKGSRTCVSQPWASGTRSKILGKMTFNHCMVVPLARSERVVGILFIGDNTGPTSFTADEVSAAEDIGAYIVRILENLELFEILSIRSRAQTSLIETAASLQKEIESHEMYRLISEKIIELIPCNEMAFYVFDWDRGVGNPVYATGPYAAEVMEDRDFPSSVGYVGHVARTKKVEIIQDTEEDSRGEPIPATPATHSRMLAVPILGRKEVLGVIELLKYPPDNFTNEDVEVATMFANHAAVAMENSKLLQEVSRTRDQVELHMDLLSHDIANYTTPITAYIDSLRARGGLDPEATQAIEKTYTQADNIMQLVDMVRTMAKLRENRQSKLVPTDLRATIEKAVAEVKARNGPADFQVTVKFPRTPVLVIADELLKEVFTNMMTTMAKSSRSVSARLEISAEVKEEGSKSYWWVKVAQPGRSIPDNLKSEVLMMTKSSRSELTSGFGIGLATARSIVERYSGHMWVTDLVPRNPSKGCVFNMTLPKAK